MTQNLNNNKGVRKTPVDMRAVLPLLCDVLSRRQDFMYLLDDVVVDDLRHDMLCIFCGDAAAVITRRFAVTSWRRPWSRKPTKPC